MIQLEFISASNHDGLVLTASTVSDGKVYSFVKKYSEHGIVADEEGNVFTEGEVFNAFKMLETCHTPEEPKPAKKKAVKKTSKKK